MPPSVIVGLIAGIMNLLRADLEVEECMEAAGEQVAVSNIGLPPGSFFSGTLLTLQRPSSRQ